MAVMKLKEGTSPLKPAGVCGGVLSFGVQALEIKKCPMNVNSRASFELVTTNQSKGKNRRSVTDFKEAGKIGIKRKSFFYVRQNNSWTLLTIFIFTETIRGLVLSTLALYINFSRLTKAPRQGQVKVE